MKFGDDRLRGFCLAGGQSSPFSIDFDGRPYDSATLPRALSRGSMSRIRHHYAKNYETTSTFVKVMQKKLWPLFWTRCI